MSGTDVSRDEAAIEAICRGLKTAAVLGVHKEPARPAHYVPAFVYERGVRILGVNPRFAGDRLFDENVHDTLPAVAALGAGALDLVNVFRPSQVIDQHVPEILAMDPLPRVVWLQLGIQNDEAMGPLLEAGIDVVQNRCLLVDYRRYV